MSAKRVYTHLSQHDQILKRPAQHIGSISNELVQTWIADETELQVFKKEFSFNSGLIHIFYEILSNSQDNYFRSIGTDHPLKKIEITIDPESQKITIWNDGLAIPTVIHKWKKGEEKVADSIYEATLIFGVLNSSGNYNDSGSDGPRVVGGLHGFGAKLTNIFSTEFHVETFDPETGLRFRQSFSENMKVASEPEIKSLKQKKGLTEISYIADFQRFGVSGYSADMIAAMRKLAIDCAMITGQKVIFNGVALPTRDLIDYSIAYTGKDTARVEFKSADSTVVVCEKPSYEPGFVQISFVNGIATNEGGVHVNAWKDAIFKPLLEKICNKFKTGKKSTQFKMTSKNLENYLMIFIKCNLQNPEFQGQTKEKLTGPPPSIDNAVTPGKITGMLKWPFINEIEESIELANLKELQKTNGNKTRNMSGIPGADDAVQAGSKNSDQCTCTFAKVCRQKHLLLMA